MFGVRVGALGFWVWGLIVGVIRLRMPMNMRMPVERDYALKVGMAGYLLRGLTEVT